MSGPSDKGRFSRRSVAIGGGIAVALGLTAVGVTVPHLFAKRYKPSPYDDLFAKLVDRDAAVKLGRAALESRARSRALPIDYAGMARVLRGRLSRRSLTDVTASDLDQNKLAEAQGWVLPETLLLLSVLAASES